MPDHTPGPWRYDPADTGTTGEWGPAVVHDGEGSPYIAEIVSEHREADARLIAAAPDLLAALEEVDEAAGLNGSGAKMAAACRRVHDLLSAIAKVDG